MTPKQLPIHFGHGDGFSAEFLVAPCNETAHGWVMRWPGWGASALALAGPSGSGKSHLAHLFALKAGGVVVPARDLTLDDIPALAEQKVVALEDGDCGMDERAVLHLYNLLNQVGGSLLVTGREAPSRWGVALPDLRSRLSALQLAVIGAPDDTLLATLLAKLFADRQLRVGEDVISYLALRIERSFDAARSVVAALDAAALAEQRPISVPLAREVLGRFLSPSMLE